MHSKTLLAVFAALLSMSGTAVAQNNNRFGGNRNGQNQGQNQGQNNGQNQGQNNNGQNNGQNNNNNNNNNNNALQLNPAVVQAASNFDGGADAEAGQSPSITYVTSRTFPLRDLSSEGHG